MGQKVECKGRSVIGLEFVLMEENSLFLNTDLNLGTSRTQSLCGTTHTNHSEINYIYEISEFITSVFMQSSEIWHHVDFAETGCT